MQHHTQNGRAATGCTFLLLIGMQKKNESCKQSRDINQAWLDKGFRNLKGDGAGLCQRKRTATRWLCLAQKKTPVYSLEQTGANRTTKSNNLLLSAYVLLRSYVVIVESFAHYVSSLF